MVSSIIKLTKGIAHSWAIPMGVYTLTNSAWLSVGYLALPVAVYATTKDKNEEATAFFAFILLFTLMGMYGGQ
jgi:hypothetical protein